jgi:hypothetical protein
LAASTLPCPSMIASSSPISTGLVKPNSRMLSAICRICFLEWVRAFLAQGRRRATAIASMTVGSMWILLPPEGANEFASRRRHQSTCKTRTLGGRRTYSQPDLNVPVGRTGFVKQRPRETLRGGLHRLPPAISVLHQPSNLLLGRRYGARIVGMKLLRQKARDRPDAVRPCPHGIVIHLKRLLIPDTVGLGSAPWLPPRTNTEPRIGQDV